MGILQSDLLLRTALELILRDVRENPWLIEDIFSDLIEDPLLAEAYGQKEIDQIKEWVKNNKIDVYMKLRSSNQDYPCVTIAMANSDENLREAVLADTDGGRTVDLEPSRINKPIPYVVKPVVPISFDPSTGTLEFGQEVDLRTVAPGMMVVNPDTGAGYIIDNLTSNNGVVLLDASDLDASRVGIVPKNRKWRARLEASTFTESFSIGVHVSSDPLHLIWLHSIIVYGLLRYKETLLEARNFQLSTFSSSDMSRNQAFDAAGDNVFSRYIRIQGLTEHTWLKSPKRFIESTALEYDGIKAHTDVDTPEEVVHPDPRLKDGWSTIKSSLKQSKRKIARRN